MAVQVYKQAETAEEKRATSLIRGVECVFKNITVAEISHYLEMGYSLTAGDWLETEVDEPESEATLNPIREEAKAAGIEGYETKRIKTLTGELDAIQNTGG